MSTGTCGINCDVCQLNLLGTCSTCGPGNSREAAQKLAAQTRILGNTCPILACASVNRIAYCLRDCHSFPCDHFRKGPYPFSQGYIDMQARRRREKPPAWGPDHPRVTVPADYWEAMQTKDVVTLCNLTLFSPCADRQLLFRFLQEDILIDIKDRCLKRRSGDGWQKTADPLLELVTLVYLIRVDAVYPLGRDIVGPQDLKEGHFFRGPHALQVAPLLQRYGHDIDGFKKTAAYLAGEPLDLADAAFRLRPFPRVPLYYLLWQGDEEFAPRISVLFERSIEKVLAADAIWGLVNRVSGALLAGPDTPTHAPPPLARNGEV
ncbi:MAG: DUF3786 domain-containing protein [Desulfobacterales bacterium]|nr:MAG: DUF3786 domain-containing protein [Desulfobacterales bacterium]